MLTSVTLTEVTSGDGGGGGDDSDSDSSSRCSQSSAYSFTSDSLSTAEVAGDSLHEHACASRAPLIVRKWDNHAVLWRRLSHQPDENRFVDEGGVVHNLRGKIVKVSVKRRKKKTTLVTCLHKKGERVCPLLVRVDHVPVILRRYDRRRDSFSASVLGVNNGRLKCTALQLYPYTNVSLVDVHKFAKTGVFHLQRELRKNS